MFKLHFRRIRISMFVPLGALALALALLAAATLLAGFNLAPGSIGSFQASGSQSNSPNTSQIELPKQGEAAFSNPVEGGKSQLGPDATVGQTSAMLAAETLLLDTNIYSVDVALVIK
jgi:hypothetical protein